MCKKHHGRYHRNDICKARHKDDGGWTSSQFSQQLGSSFNTKSKMTDEAIGWKELLK